MATTLKRHTIPVDLDRVTFDGGFWGPRLERNRTVTIPAEYEMCRDTGRIQALERTWRQGEPNKPHIFWDSDVAKWIEAVAYSLQVEPDDELRRRAERVVKLVIGAQEADGYLNSYFAVVEPDARWTNLRDQHELYCAGHLIEAAVAWHEATGERDLLDALCRYADHIGRAFGPGAEQKKGYPGHEEIELALVKLYRATGERRYLDLAAFFVDQRGTSPHYFRQEALARGEDPDRVRRPDDYWQAHLPVRRQTTAEGHAVRALYLYCGMLDVAVETNDRELFNACKALWKSITERRMYVTGAIGSERHDERFTFDYDLPNETAYAETCANIALVLFAHRLLQVEPHTRYADVLEHTLYNSVISGVSLDGTRFLYENWLAVVPEAHLYRQQGAPRRVPWFDCACCPPNLARLLAALGQYVYSQADDQVWVHLYAAGKATLDLGHTTVELVQETAYPWKETVTLTLAPAAPSCFAVNLRIPGWCHGSTVRVNGEQTQPRMVKGYARLTREWRRGDRIELVLPMPIQRVMANPAVRQDVGRVALQRGPVIYCLEEVDNGRGLDAVVLPRDAKLTARYQPDLLGGAVQITGRAKRHGWTGGKRLYAAAAPTQTNTRIKAVPYALWGNRRPGEMRVWIRESGSEKAAP